MPDYKLMYELVVRQTNKAVELLCKARVDEIVKAIDLLENAHKDAENLYINACEPICFVQAVYKKKDDK